LLPKSFKRKISVVCKFSPKSPVKVWNTIKINVHRKAKSHSLLVAFLGHPFLPCPLQSANLTFPPYVGFHFGIKNLAVLTMFLQPHFNEINCLRPFPHFFFWFFFFFFSVLEFEFRVLVLATQALCHLSHTFSPFCSSYFSDRVLCFCFGLAWTEILLQKASRSWNHRCVLP
jgi:hypothetical protein